MPASTWSELLVFSDFGPERSSRVLGNDLRQLVSSSVRLFVPSFSQDCLIRFFWFFAWSQGTIVQKTDRARFSKKNLVWLFWAKKGVKMGFLSFFSKTALNDLSNFVYRVRGDDSPSFCKNRMSRKLWFSSYGPKRVDQSDGWNPPCHYGRNRSPKYEMHQIEMIQRCFATSQL